MKKTIYFSLVAFLLLLGCSKVDDASVTNPGENQLKSASTNKILTAHRWTEENVGFDFWCGEQKIDDVFTGDIDVHCTMQYENDVLLFMNMTFRGSLKGQNSEEVFKFNEIQKFDASNVKIWKDHFNIIGDKGSHYIVSATYLTEEPWVVLNKASCE